MPETDFVLNGTCFRNGGDGDDCGDNGHEGDPCPEEGAPEPSYPNED